MSAAIRRTAILAALGAGAMLGLAFAAVPLYRIFCQVTGFGGTTQRAESAAPLDAPALARARGHSIRVRFDANVAPGMGWRFRPAVVVEEVAVGQRRLAFYTAANPAALASSGTASFNVSPETMGRYFVKIDCFCFQEQRLAAGAMVQMPVLYYIDPAYLDDPDARRVEEVTLSYTFFPVEEAIATARAPIGAGPQG